MSIINKKKKKKKKKKVYKGVSSQFCLEILYYRLAKLTEIVFFFVPKDGTFIFIILFIILIF